MKAMRPLFATLAAGLLFTAALPARCDAPRGEEMKRRAAAHFDHGVELSGEQDWRAALIEFERAYALSPNPQVLYDIGQCRHELKDYAGALVAFESYLRELPAAAVPLDRRRAVEVAIDLLRERVAEVRVSTDMPGAEVSVDDVVVGIAPLAAPLSVNAGRRKISATAGSVTVVAYVEVAGEDLVEVPLLAPTSARSLRPATAGATWARSVPAPSHAGRPIGPALAAFGVAVVGLGLGTAFGLVAAADKTSLDRACPGKACPGSSQGLLDDSHLAATVSNVGFALGIAGVAAGLAFWLWPSAGSNTGGAAPRGLRRHVDVAAVGLEATL